MIYERGFNFNMKKASHLVDAGAGVRFTIGEHKCNSSNCARVRDPIALGRERPARNTSQAV